MLQHSVSSNSVQNFCPRHAIHKPRNAVTREPHPPPPMMLRCIASYSLTLSESACNRSSKTCLLAVATDVHDAWTESWNDNLNHDVIDSW
eukprot:962955-Amphidinium_carterae.1